MTSILTSAAQQAHAAAAALLSHAQIQPGSTIPSKETVKEGNPEQPVTLDLKGKNIIVGVPGAFTPPCSSQVPQYIQEYEKFKAKGVNDVYVITVNDAFVTEAWKEKLAPSGTGVRFIADDKGAFLASLGLLFDASGLLGAPRSKRFVIVADDDTVTAIAVEQDPTQITVTAAQTILAQL